MLCLRVSNSRRRLTTRFVSTGNGRAPILALIGDRVLDTVFYERLVRGGETEASTATRRRSMLLSNSNLAVFADTLDEKLLPSEMLSKMSTTDKGTAVEACVGAAFESNNYRVTSYVRKISDLVISSLEAQLNSKDTASSLYDPVTETARESLYAKLSQIEKSANQKKVGEIFTITKVLNSQGYIASFNMEELNGIPMTGITSQLSKSKKAACEEAAKMVLQRLHRAEEDRRRSKKKK